MNIMFLKINPEKTEIILFHLQSHKEQVIIRGSLIEDQCIRYSKSVKNVGVLLDYKLSELLQDDQRHWENSKRSLTEAY